MAIMGMIDMRDGKLIPHFTYFEIMKMVKEANPEMRRRLRSLKPRYLTLLGVVLTIGTPF
jgi:hypothetical protein